MASLNILWSPFKLVFTKLKRAYKHTGRFTKKIMYGLWLAIIAAYFVCGAAILLLQYVVLPNLWRYQVSIERMASTAIGKQIKMRSLQAAWHGVAPRLMIHDLTIRDPETGSELHFPEVSAVFSWWSLITAQIQFDTLAIVAPAFEITRTAQGQFIVAGFAIDPHKKDSQALEWLLAQKEIIVHATAVTWRDQLRGAPPLAFSNLNFLFRNRYHSHRFALTGRSESSLLDTFDIRGDFTHPLFSRTSTDFNNWKGELYVNLPHINLDALKIYTDDPFQLQGHGAAQTWLKIAHANLTGITSDLQLEDVHAALHSSSAPLALRKISGRIEGAWKPQTNNVPANSAGIDYAAIAYKIIFTNLSLETLAGKRFFNTDIAASYTPKRDEQAAHLMVNGKRLYLEMLQYIAQSVPLPAQSARQLRSLNPRGMLGNFRFEGAGEFSHWTHYAIEGDFQNLSLNALTSARSSPAAAPATEAANPQSSWQATSPASYLAIPSFSNLTGKLKMTEQGGHIDLQSANATVELPDYFAQSVFPFAVLNGAVSWEIDARKALTLNIQQLDFKQENIQGSLQALYRGSMSKVSAANPGAPPILAAVPPFLQASLKLKKIDLAKIPRYLPLQTPAHLSAWLSGALRGGIAQNVAVQMNGDPIRFAQAFHPVQPGFVNAAPVFSPAAAVHTSTAQTNTAQAPAYKFVANAEIVDGLLDFAPQAVSAQDQPIAWPKIEHIQGKIKLEQTRLEINADKAQIEGVDLINIKTIVADLGMADALLEITGKASGELQNMLQFVNRSPVAGWIGYVTAEMRATGAAKLDLLLKIPLANAHAAKVQGALEFAKNQLTLFNFLPPLTEVTGQLLFHEKGFELKSIAANFLNSPVKIAGGSGAEGTVSVKANGNIIAANLTKNTVAAPIKKFFGLLSGSTPYNVNVEIKKSQAAVTVESSLRGLGMKLPYPLQKTSTEAMPLHVYWHTLPSLNANEKSNRDALQVSLGSILAAHYERQKSKKNNNIPAIVTRGGIGINTAAPVSENGIAINAQFKTLDLDAWRALLNFEAKGSDANPDSQSIQNNSAQSAQNNPVQGAQKNSTQSTQENSSNGLTAWAAYLKPRTLTLNAGELLIAGKRMQNLALGLAWKDKLWQAHIDSTQVTGHFTWQPPSPSQLMGKLRARLSTLIIPKSIASEMTNVLEGKNSAIQIPTIELSADHFELFGKKMGHLELFAENQTVGAKPQWTIQKLNLKNEDAEFKAKGNWQAGGVTQLNYLLTLTDAGKLLERFGYTNVLTGGKGKLSGDISWQGLPYALDFPSLNGRFLLSVEKAQFLKVNPGAAKLLGVLNLQALPRRLTLDFRDVFSNGFAFDAMTATVKINKGIAVTDNFKMRSPNATVVIDGSADLNKEVQNLHVVVIPEINAGAASVAYALAVNPVIGLGSFLAQLFLRAPLAQAFTFEYQVTGSWQEPDVIKLQNKKPNRSGSLI